ncbi:putative oxalocrotonate tautomerase enzyme-domain-containing protein [Mycena galopus ATCC 62051]|nr:putative oxalocrotonate tautomerase enzyme-domain-containing protein [Mycena galopus ATCC 62051]
MTTSVSGIHSHPTQISTICLSTVLVPKGLYTTKNKAAVAQAITDIYTKSPSNLPAFYVVVLFIDLDTTSFFVGGEAREHMVRISAEHLARNFPEKRGFMDRYEATLVPFTKGRGIDWKVQITKCDVRTHSPAEKSVEEEIWKEENRAVPPEEMQALIGRRKL